MKKTGKLIALLLAISLCMSLIVLPASAAEISKEDFEAAIVETALAYYNKGMPVQFDGGRLVIQDKDTWGGACRLTTGDAPEEASEDYTLFSTGPDWCYTVYYNAFGYKLMDAPRLCRADKMIALKVGDPLVVYKCDPTGKDSGATKDLDVAMSTARAGLQVGDVIASYGTSGHAMLYIGDYKGDGHDYVIHCWGEAFDGSTSEDFIETDIENANPEGGAIRIDDIDENVFTDASNTTDGVWNLRTTTKGGQGFVVLRPFATNEFKALSLSEAAKTRLQYRGLEVNKMTSISRYCAAQTGDELKLTVTITNNGTAAYAGLTVTEPLPTGATLKSAGNGNAADGKITWTVDVPAGGKVELSYTVTVTAKRGEFVSFPAGTVGTMPTRATKILVGGKKLPGSVIEKAKSLREGAIAIDNDDYLSLEDPIDMINKMYDEVLGVKLGLPTDLNAYLDALCEQQPVGGVKDKYNGWMWSPKTTGVTGDWQKVQEMIIPEHVVGWAVYTEDSPENERDELRAMNRVLEYKASSYEVGDAFIALADPDVQNVNDLMNVLTYVYLGDGKVLAWDILDGVHVDDFDATIELLYGKNIIFALRPTQAYDELVAGSLPFTDVTEADWFYTYVKDLYNDGTVNGMTPTTFVPKGNLTYGQALKLIVCALGHGEQASTGSHWASGYLKFAQDKGWIAGNVDLNGNVSRLAFCQIAAKAKNLTAQPASNPFTDTADASVLALNNVGVINGMTATTFDPNGLLTRAQISKIIHTLRGV